MVVFTYISVTALKAVRVLAGDFVRDLVTDG